MNPRTILTLALAAISFAGQAWADGDAKTPAVPGEAKAAEGGARQSYDALFSDILKSLPQDKRAQLDSAHAVPGKVAPASPAVKTKTGNADAAHAAAEAKREQALKELPPDVKARVDKAISDLDNRRKEKKAEFKELIQ